MEPALDLTVLAARGVFTFDTFAPTIDATREYVVDGLFTAGSVNILVGDSGLGKTPLCVLLGIAVAAGVPVLGRTVRQGRVLFCDAESPREQFQQMVGRISSNLGLPRPPSEFYYWSPNWDVPGTSGDPVDRLLDHVQYLRPTLVIADPLRVFWPSAESKTEEAMAMINPLRQTGATWIITHHRRKPSREQRLPQLDEDPHGWLQEAAGSHALINNTDARLGVEPSLANPHAELVVGGFVRGTGHIAPIYLAREYDEIGEPLGYRALSGRDLLSERFRSALIQLQSPFRFTDAKRALGGSSDSNTKRFLDQCVQCRLVRREGAAYVRLDEGNGVDGAERRRAHLARAEPLHGGVGASLEGELHRAPPALQETMEQTTGLFTGSVS